MPMGPEELIRSLLLVFAEGFNALSTAVQRS
jgi:hypothetical protein